MCSACGHENEAAARFCVSCGASLASEPPVRSETRRVVTVLCSDVVGFTGIGEELDPESLRKLMGRYFKRVQTIVERHEGTTEKFIGDAVVAVFGVPRSHEDDAHRAVRAAVEIRDALAELNEEFGRHWGVELRIRTGVNTGEVVAGDHAQGQSFVAGDAVTVAARFEEAAAPGDILAGETTYRLVADAVTAEPLPPLKLKGKAEPVPAWRVLDMAPVGPRWARRLDSPLVGRERELDALRSVFDRSVERGECQVTTLIGVAGVGKSRLTGELVAALGEGATVVGGRCLPYGEGITFWPITELLRAAAGISDVDSDHETRRKLGTLLEEAPDAAIVGERLSGFLGLTSATPGVQETFWSVRKLLEALAARRPLLVVFDDIQWAEPTFLDLLEYLADWIRGVPVMLLFLARPELMEVRGGWLASKANASLVQLSPLSDAETDGLISNLLGGGRLVDDARRRIAEAAEGNPLFVGETLRMLVDDGLLEQRDGSWVVAGDLSSLRIPPTIHALLTARIDRLEDEERGVIERASVIGRVFWWGAVAELSPDEQRPRVGGHLQALTRKQLIMPDRSVLADEDAFRFAHILAVDAAYNRIPKAARVELHERFAAWVDHRSRDGLRKREEIVGYHLERAHTALSELGTRSERTVSLGRRAAAALASAGRRAFARGDMPAAVNLLTRAEHVAPDDDPLRMELLPELAFALLETGDFGRLQEIVAETTEAAHGRADARLEAQAVILGLWVRLFTDPEGWAQEAQREATRAISIFEREADERGLAKAWSLLGLFYLTTCQFHAAGEAWERAAAHAATAGDEREHFEALSWVPLTVWAGPTPVEDGIERCRSIVERSGGDRKALSTALATWGAFEAMRGRAEEARELSERARATLEEIALPVWLAGPFSQLNAWTELLAGAPAAAERQLRWALETLREIGELAWLSTVVGILAEAVRAQGRLDESDELLGVGEETAGTEDAYSQALFRSVRAKIRAEQGTAHDAVRLAREAVEIARATDFLFLEWFALASLADVLELLEREDEAGPLRAQAAEVAARKGLSVGAAGGHASLATGRVERTA
ncbi:MAG TPA: adenylate/guanylate cyclase domain-containing protein [Gaiellaceae bacterium]|nr:adenylate/guanylate cyclase domain-containing protein [Gaiellaceae bacterium]